ncbi:uncharacterized mitochondrial protein-like protein [Tanacetum coccineum]
MFSAPSPESPPDHQSTVVNGGQRRSTVAYHHEPPPEQWSGRVNSRSFLIADIPETQTGTKELPCIFIGYSLQHKGSSDPILAAQVTTPNPITSITFFGVQDTNFSQSFRIKDLLLLLTRATRSKSALFSSDNHHADLASLTNHPLHVVYYPTTKPRGFKTAAKGSLIGWKHDLRSFQAYNKSNMGTIEDQHSPFSRPRLCSQNSGLTTITRFSPVVMHPQIRIVISLTSGVMSHLRGPLVYMHDVLLVYVDTNLILTEMLIVIATFTSRLNHEFAIKGTLRLTIILEGLDSRLHGQWGLFLTQSKYARDILKRADLYDSKPVSTPLATHVSFTADGIPYSDSTLYRSLVGALQYLNAHKTCFMLSVNQFHNSYMPQLLHIFSLSKEFFGMSKAPSHLVSLSVGLTQTQSSGGNLVSWSAKSNQLSPTLGCEPELSGTGNSLRDCYGYSFLLQDITCITHDVGGPHSPV